MLPSPGTTGRNTTREEASSPALLSPSLTVNARYPANQRKNYPEPNIKSKVQAGTEGQYLDFYELFTIA